MKKLMAAMLSFVMAMMLLAGCVSSLVAARCNDRTDVFIPNEPIRDAEGRIVGCKSLGRV